MTGIVAALLMCASFCILALGALVGILVWWIADQRGERRPRRHRRRRVRSKRTRPSSRGPRPYRSGRVRL